MSTTDDGISRRQATFDTDPINHRKQGANIQLPVIEGDKEVTIDNKKYRDFINEPGEAVSEVRVKNLTHVIDTRADINFGVKAISQKAKSHQQEKEKIHADKKIADAKDTNAIGHPNSLNEKTALKERNDVIGFGVKAISEKARAQQQEQKETVGNNKNTLSEIGGKVPQLSHTNINKTKISGEEDGLNNRATYSLKAVTDKGKAKKSDEEKKTESDKENKTDINNPKISEKEGKSNTQAPYGLKAINDTAKAKKDDKENSTRNKSSPVSVKDKGDTKIKVPVTVKDKADTKNKPPVSVRDKVDPKNKPNIEEKRENVISKGEDKIKANKKEHNKLIDPNKKNSNKNSKHEDNQKLAGLPKIEEKVKNASPTTNDRKSTGIEKTTKPLKTQNHITNENLKKDVDKQKVSVNIVSVNDNAPAHSIKESPYKKDKNKGLTDKSKAKAGVSVNKDSHSASGTTVAKGNSPKPISETSQNKEAVSKLTVGSAPRVTTLKANEEIKKQKESLHKTLESAKKLENVVGNKEKVNSIEQKSEHPKPKLDKDQVQSNIPSSNTALDIDLTQNIENMEGRNGESYETVYAERNTLLKAEIAYKRRIKQLEDEANDFLKHINQLTIENTRLHARVDALEGKLSTADNGSVDRISLQQDYEGKSSEGGQKSDNQISELKAQVIRLQTENQTANEELIKVKSELLSESRKLHALEKEKKSLASSVTAVESEKLDEIKDLQTDHSKLKKENKVQKDKIGELEKKVESLEFENNTLSESLAQKKTELDELMGVMKDENKFDNEIKNLKNRVMKLEKEKKDMELKFNSEKRKLEEELNEMKSKFEKSNTELTELKSKTNELTSKNKQLSTSNKTLTSTCDSQKEEIEKLKEEIERLKRELADLQKQLDDLKRETENTTTSLKDKNTNLETTNKELQSIVSEKEEQISKMIAIADNLRTEKDTEKQDFEHEKQKFTTEIDRLKVFEKHMSNMEMQLKTFVEKFEESEKQKAQLSNQLEDKEYTISALEKQIFEFNLKTDTLTKRISQIDRDKREIENEKRDWEVKRDKISDIEASNKRLMEENRRLRGSLEDKHVIDHTNRSEKLPRGREAWVEEAIPIASLQKAVYVENKQVKKKVQINPEPVVQKRRMPFTKSNPVKASKPPLPKKDLKTSLSPSRSLEDVRKSPLSPTDSSPSLPELQKDGRLTYGYTPGYSQIHRNRVRAAAQKRVY